MLFALFLVSALSFYPPSATAQPVTDMYGNVVKNGGSFYILPYIFSNGGGVQRTKTGDETLPLSVVQSPFETVRGLPVIIESPIRTEFLSEGTVALSFVDKVTIEPSLLWTVVEGLSEGTVVKVDGYPKTVKGSFSIHRVIDNRYKLKFCTSRGSLCGNVGLVRDNAENRIFVITQGKPFEFVLEPLPSASSK